jgi:hypothetical protein
VSAYPAGQKGRMALGQLLGRTGREAEARQLLEVALRDGRSRSFDPYWDLSRSARASASRRSPHASTNWGWRRGGSGARGGSRGISRRTQRGREEHGREATDTPAKPGLRGSERARNESAPDTARAFSFPRPL